MALATMQAAPAAASPETGDGHPRASPEPFRNRDTTYAYRFDSYFYYLTAFRRTRYRALLVPPAGQAVLVRHRASILFCRAKDVEQIWDGYHLAPTPPATPSASTQPAPLPNSTRQLGALPRQPAGGVPLGRLQA